MDNSSDLLSCLDIEDFNRIISEHEYANKVKFIHQWITRVVGKDVRWSSRKGSQVQLPFTGIPYIIVGYIVLECAYGSLPSSHQPGNKGKSANRVVTDHNYNDKHYRFVQRTKKANCPAKIYAQEIIEFPEYQISSNLKWLKTTTSNKLKTAILTNAQSLAIQHRIVSTIPNIADHANHFLGPLSETCLGIDPRIAEKIRQLFTDGVRHLPEMRRHLANFVNKDLFRGKEVPLHTDARYWPTGKTILNHIHLSKTSNGPKLSDVQNLMHKISLWKVNPSHVNDKFFFAPSDDSGHHSFMYQSPWQRRMLTRYGNAVCLVDATYHTTCHGLPLLVFCVPSNVGFFNVAFYILPRENRSCIKDAVATISTWNPDWNPRYIMSDFSTAQIAAFEDVFPSNHLVLYAEVIN